MSRRPDVRSRSARPCPCAPLCAASITTPPMSAGRARRDQRQVDAGPSTAAMRVGGRHPGDRDAVGADGDHLSAEPAAQHRDDQALDPRRRGRAPPPAPGSAAGRSTARSARCSRRSITPTEVSVGRIGNSTTSTPSSMPLRHPVAGVGEDVGHRPVLRQHLGHELGDAALPGRLGEVLQQQLGDARGPGGRPRPGTPPRPGRRRCGRSDRRRSSRSPTVRINATRST